MRKKISDSKFGVRKPLWNGHSKQRNEYLDSCGGEGDQRKTGSIYNPPTELEPKRWKVRVREQREESANTTITQYSKGVRWIIHKERKPTAFTIFRLNPRPNGEMLGKRDQREERKHGHTQYSKGGSNTIRKERKLTAFTIFRLNPKPNGESLEPHDQREETQTPSHSIQLPGEGYSLNMAEKYTYLPWLT